MNTIGFGNKKKNKIIFLFYVVIILIFLFSKISFGTKPYELCSDDSGPCRWYWGASWLGVHPLEKGECNPGEVCNFDCQCQLVDADLDGYVSQDAYDTLYSLYEYATRKHVPVDCNDRDSFIHPGAMELCDYKDNNCNGLVDEYTTDENSDGYYEAVDPTKSACQSRLFVCKERLPDCENFNVEEQQTECPLITDEKCNPDNLDETLCKSDDYSNDLSSSCAASNLPEELGEYDYYAYICQKLDIDSAQGFNNIKICWLASEGTYNVCAEKETECGDSFSPEECCTNNKDDDCDGKIDQDDPDCKILCLCPEGHYCVGGCDLTQSAYCTESGEWVLKEENEALYCRECSEYDSRCEGIAVSCDPGESFCGGGCIPGACDYEAHMWCDNGIWRGGEPIDEFCEKCGVVSSICAEECEMKYDYDKTGTYNDVCDTSANEMCKDGEWTSENYCEGACKVRDPDCDTQCNPELGFPAICDIASNRYCKDDGTWSDAWADDYCLKCGSIDSECGIKECTPGTCDYWNDKYCAENKEWDDWQYCSHCPGDNVGELKCVKECVINEKGINPATGEEINCSNKDVFGKDIDDDCDGLANCQDPDCSDDPYCLVTCPVVGKETLCEDVILINTTIIDGNIYSSCGGLGREADPGCCYKAVKTCQEDHTWGECKYNPSDLEMTMKVKQEFVGAILVFVLQASKFVGMDIGLPVQDTVLMLVKRRFAEMVWMTIVTVTLMRTADVLKDQISHVASILECASQESNFALMEHGEIV